MANIAPYLLKFGADLIGSRSAKRRAREAERTIARQMASLEEERKGAAELMSSAQARELERQIPLVEERFTEMEEAARAGLATRGVSGPAAEALLNRLRDKQAMALANVTAATTIESLRRASELSEAFSAQRSRLTEALGGIQQWRAEMPSPLQGLASMWFQREFLMPEMERMDIRRMKGWGEAMGLGPGAGGGAVPAQIDVTAPGTWEMAGMAGVLPPGVPPIGPGYTHQDWTR